MFSTCTQLPRLGCNVVGQELTLTEQEIKFDVSSYEQVLLWGLTISHAVYRSDAQNLRGFPLDVFRPMSRIHGVRRTLRRATNPWLWKVPLGIFHIRSFKFLFSVEGYVCDNRSIVPWSYINWIAFRKVCCPHVLIRCHWLLSPQENMRCTKCEEWFCSDQASHTHVEHSEIRTDSPSRVLAGWAVSGPCSAERTSFP